MRQYSAAALVLAFALAANIPATKAGEAENDGPSDDLTIAYYREIAHRFPERLGFACWAAYETYKRGEFKDAQDMFETCAQHNHAQSMIFLSQIYLDGSGVPQDPVASTEWLRRAAETGYRAGQYDYGLALLRGLGTPQDLEAGKEWIRRAAAQGDTDAAALIAAGFNLSVVTAAR